MSRHVQPLVSVVITTYNQARYIGETIETALVQTYPCLEVIVVDDGSTDETPDVVRSYGRDVDYIRQRNKGIAASRNVGIRRARGELVAFLDGDDLWTPDKIEAQVDAWRRHPGSALILTDVLHFSGLEILWSGILERFLKRQFASCPDEVTSGSLYERLLESNFISTTSQVMVPAAVLDTVGLSDTRFRVGSDYDLYLRIAARFPVTCVRRVLTRWRYLETSASGPGPLRMFRWNEEVFAVWRRHLEGAEGESSRRLRTQIRVGVWENAQKAYYYGCEHDRSWATRYLLRFAARNPSSCWVALFAAGLWVPTGLVAPLGHAVRRMFRNWSAAA